MTAWSVQHLPRGAAGKLLVSSLVAFHVLLLAWSAHVHSPTLNEPGHLAAGISNWQFGRFDVYRVNPPLVRMVAAIPALAAETESDWARFSEGAGARPEFALGEDLVAANGERAMWLFTLARWGCIPFSLLGGWVCYRWASDLYGGQRRAREDEVRQEWHDAPRRDSRRGARSNTAGLLALALWCFCPNILGHSALITPDCAVTALGVAASYTFWRWLKEPTWGHTFISGLVLGVAELAKTTLVVLYPLWPVLWLVYRWAERRTLTPSPSPVKREGDHRSHLAPQAELSRRPRWLPWWCLASRGESRRGAACHTGAGAWWLRELGMLAVRMVIAIYVINLGYGFEGSLTRLGDYRFVSAVLGAEDGEEKARAEGGNRFSGTWLANVPVPLPNNYLLGIDIQRRDFENYRRPSYLRGEFQEKGWWYYYLYALAIKVPLGTWMMIGLAAFCRRLAPQDESFRGTRSPNLRDEFILLAPAVAILLFVSSQTGFSEHMRYVLPIFPFFFIWIGWIVPASVAPSPPASLPQGERGGGGASLWEPMEAWAQKESPHSAEWSNHT